MTNRKAGWYWVKILHEDCAWEVMRLEVASTQLWFMAGSNQPVPEYEIAEIGPRIPTPDEPWQCVPVEPTSVMEDVLSAWADNPSQSWIEVLAAAPKPEDV